MDDGDHRVNHIQYHQMVEVIDEAGDEVAVIILRPLMFRLTLHTVLPGMAIQRLRIDNMVLALE